MEWGQVETPASEMLGRFEHHQRAFTDKRREHVVSVAADERIAREQPADRVSVARYDSRRETG